MKTSENIEALAKALAAAQKELKNATLNKTNPHFKSKYADLAGIRDATAPILAKHGLSISQFTTMLDGGLVLSTRLLHESGQWMEGEYPLPLVLEKPQAMGSALTYARRYCWSAVCGIAAEEDDDGLAAQSNGAKAAPKKEPDTWFGPQSKTELKDNMRAVAAIMRGHSMTTTGDLEEQIDPYRETIEQAKRDAPGWHESFEAQYRELQARLVVGHARAGGVDPNNPSSYKAAE